MSAPLWIIAGALLLRVDQEQGDLDGPWRIAIGCLGLLCIVVGVIQGVRGLLA